MLMANMVERCQGGRPPRASERSIRTPATFFAGARRDREQWRETREEKRSREEKEEIPTRRTFQSSRTVLGSCVCVGTSSLGLATTVVGEALWQLPAVGRFQGRVVRTGFHQYHALESRSLRQPGRWVRAQHAHPPRSRSSHWCFYLLHLWLGREILPTRPRERLPLWEGATRVPASYRRSRLRRLLCSALVRSLVCSVVHSVVDIIVPSFQVIARLSVPGEISSSTSLSMTPRLVLPRYRDGPSDRVFRVIPQLPWIMDS